MYNILISLAAGTALGLVAAQFVGTLPAVIPALLLAGVVMFLLARRTAAQVQAEIEQVVPLLQARQIDAAKTRLRGIQDRYGRWQILLDGQMQSQLGMIDYLQMKFDTALPQLQKGQFQNWTAQVCIGAIHYRKNRRSDAWEQFAKAARTAPKEAIIYLVWATLLTRDGKRADALKALDEGLQSMPDSQHLKTLRKRVANKKRIQVREFPETWYQFFPEEMAQQMMMRGKRGVQQQVVPQQRIGARRAPRR